MALVPLLLLEPGLVGIEYGLKWSYSGNCKLSVPTCGRNEMPRVGNDS